MSASPGATPVATPALDIVTAALFDDSHAASPVTECDVPSDIEAVAVNWDVAPTGGVAPVTATETTVTFGTCGVVGAVGEPPQAA